MTGASLFAEAVAVAALIADGAWVVWQMKQRRAQATSEHSWGDFPAVPDEARFGGSANRSRGAGGASRSADRAADDTHNYSHVLPHGREG